MAFPNPPKTWTFQESVESSELNGELRDALLVVGPHLIARRTADQSTVSTTLANDDTLVTPSIAANEVWQFRFLLSVITGAGGLKSSFSIPTGGDLQMTRMGPDSAGASYVEQARLTATDGSSLNYITNASVARLYVLEVLYINAGNAGAVTHRIALSTASGTSTVKAQSTLWGVKLA